MDKLPKIQEVYALLLQYTPDEDPLILSLALGLLVFLLVTLTWLLFRKKKSPSKTTAVSVPSETEKELKPKPESPSIAIRRSPEEVEEISNLDRKGWLTKLQSGLQRTRGNLVESLSKLMGSHDVLEEEQLEEIHELLFRADLGVETADKLVDHLRSELKGKENITWPDIKMSLTAKVSELLNQNSQPINIPSEGPQVILIVGVNGVGKTTSIGKLAAHFMAENKKVLLCAADTYRAAAIDQLQVWGDRLGVDVVKHNPGADPASVAFDGVKAAISRKCDVLLIDTAGRLHNKIELMDELGKIKRVIGKDLPNAPHETWLVIDSTTGQNAFQQVKAFSEVVDLTGLVVTKLDGTAKGGVVIGVTDKFKKPIRYIGVGEKAADLHTFNPQDFASSLFI